MSFKKMLTQILLVSTILFASSCTRTPPTPPAVLRDWQTSTPEEQGMDSAKLEEMMEFIKEQGLDIDSVVVVRSGYIVLDEYPNREYGREYVHPLYSVKKSVFSALIGIAIQEGFSESVDQKVEDFFPERTIVNLDSQKQNMTLEHLLTMTSGLEWDERTYPYGDPRNNWTAALRRDDPALFALDRPMANGPGVEWVYNTGGSYLLSVIITKTTGYGYQRWILPQRGVYCAAGWKKQRIYVIPDLHTIVAFTANISDEDPDPESWLLYNFIGAAADWELFPGGRYTKYGLSFDYPGGMYVTAEMPIPGEEMVSEDSGWVQFDRDYPFEQIGVIGRQVVLKCWCSGYASEALLSDELCTAGGKGDPASSKYLP